MGVDCTPFEGPIVPVIYIVNMKDPAGYFIASTFEGEQYRVSMRSKGEIDIGAVAKEFSGGGHKNAAGCTVTGAIDALQKLFVEKIERAIDVPDGRNAGV